MEFAQLFPLCPNFPTFSVLCGHFCTHTHTQAHTMVQRVRSSMGWSSEMVMMVIWIFRAEGSWGYAEFTRPWSGDPVCEPLMLSDMSLTSSVHYICSCHKKTNRNGFHPQIPVCFLLLSFSICTLVFKSPLGLAPSQHLVSFFVLLLQSVTSCYLPLCLSLFLYVVFHGCCCL